MTRALIAWAVLTCPSCGRTGDPASDWRCACGSPLEFADDLVPEAASLPEPDGIDRSCCLWGFEAFLPSIPPLSLGEGWTPLVDATSLLEDSVDEPAVDEEPVEGASVDEEPVDEATSHVGESLPRSDSLAVSVKLEYVSPTGSFKDRGAAVTVALAADLGVDRVLEDSSGNAGLAIATYAARAGLDARIYVPAAATESKVAAIERTGADLRRVEGDRAAVTDACVDAVAAGDGWYASHAWHPAFYAGTATIAYEIAAQRGWSVPDAFVTPVGHGTLLLGAYRGFSALREAGWTDQMPRLLGVQAAGVAPLVEARRGESAAGATADEEPNDLADGIQVATPARREQVLDALEATDGDVLAVGAEETAAARGDLARAGFHVEPTSAVALAGLRAYLEEGVLAGDADVVVPLTGSGLKG